jgi:hypothetical protein
LGVDPNIFYRWWLLEIEPFQGEVKVIELPDVVFFDHQMTNVCHLYIYLILNQNSLGFLFSSSQQRIFIEALGGIKRFLWGSFQGNGIIVLSFLYHRVGVHLQSQLLQVLHYKHL